MNVHEGIPLQVADFEHGSKELDREVLYQQGSMQRVRIWYEGHSHWQGKNIWGDTGPEHVIEKTIIKARIIEFPSLGIPEEPLPDNMLIFKSMEVPTTEIPLVNHEEVTVGVSGS